MTGLQAGPDGWPSRAGVEALWSALVAGAIDRADVHEWVRPWVEGDSGPAHPGDVMVMRALQTLHGFGVVLVDRSADGVVTARRWMHPDSAVAEGLETWLTECRDQAADPVGWMERRRAAVRRLIGEESDRTADPRS